VGAGTQGEWGCMEVAEGDGRREEGSTGGRASSELACGRREVTEERGTEGGRELTRRRREERAGKWRRERVRERARAGEWAECDCGRERLQASGWSG